MRCCIPFEVKMVFTLCLSLLQCRCLKPFCLHVFLLHLIGLGILVHAILVFLVSNKMVSYTSKQFHFNCPTCSLGKSLRLSLRLTSHKNFAPLELFFSDV